MATDNEEREFTVTAEVTIGVFKRVMARSQAEAQEKAEALGLPGLCWSCSGAGKDSEDAWQIDGLDGEPCNIEVEE